MTKKFGEHKYDKYICTTLSHLGKYVIQENTAPFKLTYPDSIKNARTLISYNESGYAPASLIGALPQPVKAVSVQIRPPAAPAPKAYVPKGNGKRPAKPAPCWPYPQSVPPAISELERRQKAKATKLGLKAKFEYEGKVYYVAENLSFDIDSSLDAIFISENK